MVIEIRRAGFTNKGAELMFRAVVEQIRSRIPDATIVTIPDKLDSYCERGKLCVYQKIWYQRYGFRWGNIGAVVPRRIRRRYGLYMDSEIDVVLDTAGFAYGDQWPLSNLAEAVKSSSRWKKRKTKVVFLPQAFGPFSDRRRRRLVDKLIQNADLVFPREKDSYDHIVSAVGPRGNVQVAPDFTNLVEGFLPDWFDTEKNRFCVIPNYRMIDKTTDSSSNDYLPMMRSAVAYLLETGAKPFVLIHEGKNDEWLAEQMVADQPEPIEVVMEPNALAIKGIIGQSDGVLSSRFHGLVSALSQGVPALGTSWSHKYQMLFEDYGFADGVLRLPLNQNQLHEKIDSILNEPSRTAICHSLRNRACHWRGEAQKMWDAVFEEIGIAR